MSSSKVQSFKAKVRSNFLHAETTNRLARASSTAVDGLQLILNLFKGPADVVAVPGLKVGVEGLLFVINVIKKISQNVDDLEQLAVRIRELTDILQKSKNAGTPSKSMRDRIDHLSIKWIAIAADVKKLASRGMVGRTLNYVNDAASIACHVQAISWSIENFKIETMLAVEFSLDQVRDDNTRFEGKLDHVQETLNDGFQGVMAKLDVKDGRPPIVFSASFESLDPQKVARCFDGTRVDVLGQLRRWIGVEDASDSNVPNTPIFWINGSAGTGKTTLSYTFADECKRRGIPVASFFCSRDFADRSNPNLIFSSIAHHLGQTFPSFGDQLAEVLRSNPYLASASVPYQLEELIIKPLRCTRDSFRLCLIVIDALDECKDMGTTSTILSSLSRYVSQLSPLKILVTSRPEHAITSVFAHKSGHLNAASQCLILHKLELSVVRQDIKRYLLSALQDIRERYGLDSSWPSEEDVEALATLSFGLFIFAATSIKFIEERNDSDPQGQLTRLLSGKELSTNAQSSPYHHLDKLYTQVLMHAFPDIAIQLSGRLKMILGSVVSLQEPLSPVYLENLLGLTPSTIRQTLVHLHSILILPDHDTQLIRLHHPSFVDFITDSNRCRDANFRVDSEKQHMLLAIRCLEAMQSLKRDMCGIDNPCVLNSEVDGLHSRITDNILPHIQYACRHWMFHLTRALVSDTLVDLLKEFCNKYLLYWIEACSLLGELRNTLVGLHAAKAFLLKKGLVDLRNVVDLLHDCERFTREFFSILDISCLQVYHSALHFTPRQTTLWTLYEHKRLPLGRANNCIEETWSPCVRIMDGNPSSVSFVAFSPDGTRIVSGSNGATLQLWDAVNGAHLNTLKGHSGQIWFIAFSPDGTRIVSGSHDNTLRLWDAASGAHLSTLKGHFDRVQSYALSPDGTRIVSGSNDKTLRLWDAVSGAHLNTLKGHFDGVRSVAFSPDGTRIMSGSHDKTLRLWDAVSGAHLNTLNGDSLSDRSYAFSPDGTRIVSGSTDNTLQLWDAVSGAHLNTLKGHSELVLSYAFSPDGTRIVSGSNDKTLRLWDAVSGAHLYTLKGHSAAVLSVAFSPDGTRIVTASYDNTLRLWDAVSSAHLNTFKGHSDVCQSVAFSPNSTRIVSGSGDMTLRLWDAVSGAHLNMLKGHSDKVTSYAFLPDGTRIVSGSHDNTLRLWDAVSGAHLSTLKGHFDTVQSYAFSPDGTQIVSGSHDKTLRLWDAGSSARLNKLKGHSDVVLSIAFSPDGTRIVSGSGDKTLRLWDAVSGTHFNTLNGHSGSVWSVAFSPDGTRIVSGSADMTIRLWDAVSSAHISTLKGHSDRVQSVAFSPDGTRIVSESDDNTLRLWDAVSSTHLNTLNGHSGSTYYAFSPDGTRIVSEFNDNSLRLWDAVSGARLNTLNGHSDSLWSVTFSPDGTRIVSGSFDKTLRLWDAMSGAHLNTLMGHSGPVRSVAFSPDGTRIVSGSTDKTLRLWDAVSGVHLNTLKGHSDAVRSVAFSHDGTRIVSGSHDKTLRVWNAVTGNSIEIYNKSTYALVHSPTPLHGKSASSFHIFISDDGWVWSMDPKKRLCWIPVSYRPSNYNCLAISGTCIALGSADGRVIVLDLSASLHRLGA
ncbi:WD40 repeat-like protein [Phlegmacium glaucopus]|nr:WD40 repeat-like protein [Phlegmacium glaucopus]